MLVSLAICVIVGTIIGTFIYRFVQDMRNRKRIHNWRDGDERTLHLAKRCLDDPDGSTDKEFAAYWELETRKLRKIDIEMRTHFSMILKCPATWVHIQVAVEKLCKL